MAGRRRNWTQEHEIERLTQLRADVDSAMGRMVTETARYAADAPTEVRVELERQMELFEGVRKVALDSVDIWITERCK